MFALVTRERQEGMKMSREVYHYYYARKKVTEHFLCQLWSQSENRDTDSRSGSTWEEHRAGPSKNETLDLWGDT